MKKKKLKHHKQIKALEKVGRLILLAREEIDCAWPDALQPKEKIECVNALGLQVAATRDYINMFRIISEE